MISALEALKRLRLGNHRFVEHRASNALLNQMRRAELASGQAPFAIILGCSDSRVPAELVFDQGLGDLFVIRVAGNIVAPSQVGSVEFAAAQFKSRLVVVLGHSQCGAIAATLAQIKNPSAKSSKNIRSITDRIQPSIQDSKTYQQAVRANIRASVNHLRHGSEILEKLIKKNNLLVVGAEYSLETGVVEFLNG